MRWRVYPKYKDSGVEWLGEIPTHWEVVRAKSIFFEVKERSVSGDEELLTVSHITGVTPRSEKNVSMFMATTLEGYKKCNPGDLVINTMWAWMGALGTAFQEGLVSPSYNVYRFRHPDYEPRYYDRLFRTRKFIVEINRFSQGIWKSRLRLYPEEFFQIKVPCSPAIEQRAIAAFLDRKTAHIDTLIAKKERQIELLQEKRAALISHAVTKGLDPAVPMKDSGVEWLGEIPAHWTRTRIGYFARVLNGSTPSRNRTDYWTDGTIPWLSSGKVNNDVIAEASELITKIALQECPLEVIPSGSVVIGLVGQGRTRGMAAIMGIDATINQNMAAIIPRSKLRGRFLHYVLQQMYNPIREYGRGANQAALNCEVVAAIQIPVPPVHEQENIANYLDIQNAQFTAICNRIGDGLTILHEYRSALISAAVTGKIDLRQENTL